ncbi:MAG TPA: TonB-dependent receptor [Candidatus Eremiobacteraceae bacterium]|nr:TonB-dependent receptor [Candidatus Eremiobacteraceae bacterium]
MSVNVLGRVVASLIVAGLCLSGAAIAGTTGGISGHVADASGAPIANAKISVSAPSQSAAGTSDARGFFSVLALTPDTYTVTATKDGYDTTQVAGITVQADQTSTVAVTMRPTIKVLTTVTSTATAGVVSKSVTGDLYAVSASAVNRYQGSAGGAETLYSQNGVVGSLPGVVRSIGGGGGYGGNGSLSIRGGSNDQIGFELEGIPLNRGFDSANATSFVTNGLSSLEVYTGGAPADSGRSMAGYINEVMRRGTYPGGGDLTLVAGAPTYNHTMQADLYGASPDRKFSYYVSELAVNADYNFANRENLDNHVINVAANDPGCLAFNTLMGPNVQSEIPTPFLSCGSAHNLNVPISQEVWQEFGNISAAERDTVINLHYGILHNGMTDDLQALWVGGTTGNPYPYSGAHLDPALYAQGQGGSVVNGQLQWVFGTPYVGPNNAPYDPTKLGTYTWPTAGNSIGTIPSNYVDSQSTQSGIEKVSYTRALSSSSFARFYAYALYSAWNFDQATNGFVGDSFYQLHDNATGYTLNYQNQLTQAHLLRFDIDYSKDLSLRYNYAPNFLQENFWAGCGLSLTDPNLHTCAPGDPNNVVMKGTPFAYWNALPEINTDAALADSWKPSDRWLFDIGARLDRFEVGLTPLQILGPNGIAEQSQNLAGNCLHGYAYGPTEPCFAYLTDQVNTLGNLGPSALPGAGHWTNVSGDLNFNEFSPRFGATFTASPRDVLRFSVGRYVEPPATAYEEYIGAPQFGPQDTVSVLNNFYDGLGFTAVHNVQPQDSTNYDFSLEHAFDQGWSAKVTPYLRVTRGQILNLPVVPTNPTFVTGYNFGAARIRGSEFLLRKDRQTSNGLSAVLAATYTDSKIRYERALGGQNFIDVINASIAAYNTQYNTHYASLDPNGYYSPSLTQSPGSTTPSYDVRFTVNLNLDYRVGGWDITPTFNYQSGNPYGDSLNFPDVHCYGSANPNAPAIPTPGCIPQLAGNEMLGPLANGPDPYTNAFDAPGSLVGPSWLTMNIGVSHDIAQNIKASMLVTNVFTVVHNHGYPWEYPSSAQVLAYGDNNFYNSPLGYSGSTGNATSSLGYLGDNYYAYGPQSLNNAPEFVFSISTKL